MICLAVTLPYTDNTLLWCCTQLYALDVSKHKAWNSPLPSLLLLLMKLETMLLMHEALKCKNAHYYINPFMNFKLFKKPCRKIHNSQYIYSCSSRITEPNVFTFWPILPLIKLYIQVNEIRFKINDKYCEVCNVEINFCRVEKEIEIQLISVSTDYLFNMIPLTKSLAVDIKLPALNVTVPESSVARFFKMSVWMWPWLSPISLKGLFSSKVPSSHHCTLPGALPDSWQEKVAHSPTKTSVVLRPLTMKTSFTVKNTHVHTLSL